MADETYSVCCECTPVVEAEFGGKHDPSPLTAIVEAVASAEGVSPADLDPLHEIIDLEAIDRLLTNSSRTSSHPIFIEFSVDEWNVFVRSDGVIRVCDSNLPTNKAPAFQKPLTS